MPESVEVAAGIFALCATIWLSLGLGLSQLWKRSPARSHGILVAALTGTLLTPILYLGIQQANWGLLPAPQEIAPLPQLIRDDPPLAEVEPDPIAVLPLEAPRREAMAERSREEDATDPFTRVPEITNRAETVLALPDSVVVQEPNVHAAWKVSGKGLLLWAWFGASALMLLRLCLDFLAGYRLAKKSRPLGDEAVVREVEALACKLGLSSSPLLAVSEGIPSPVLWAWSRPARILIPAKTETSPVFRGVYLHELAHWARRDHLSASLGEIVWCLFPWHPLTWWIRRSLEARAEEACDDWAIACGCQAADYAEELVNLAPSRAGALTMAAVSQSSRLKMRVSRLLRGAFSSPRLGRVWVLGLGMAALLFTALMSILQPRIVQAGSGESETRQAEIDPPQASQTTSSGADTTEVTVMAEGKPVAGAKVWLDRRSETNWGSSWDGPLTSDALGRVKFAVEKGMVMSAFGLDEQGRTGIANLYRTAAHKPEPILTLEPTTTLEGRIVHLGKPVSGVKCKAIGLRTGETPSRGYNFPDSFPHGEVQSDEQGRIRVRYVPKGQGIECEFMDERFAWHRALLFPGKVNTISLVKAGSLELEFEGTDNPLPPAHYQWSFAAIKSDQENALKVNAYRSSTLYGENHNSIKGNKIAFIAPGKYTLSVNSTAISPYLFKAELEFQIRAEQITKIKIPTTRRVQVTGRILDATTGKGIPHYKFCLYSRHELLSDRLKRPRENRQDLREWADGITDENGDYEVYVRGKARYGFEYHSDYNMSANLDRYRLSGFDRETLSYGVQADVPETGKFAFPDLRLEPSQKLPGQVVNKQGRPLSGSIEIFHPIWPSKRYEYMTERELKEGAFECVGIPPGKPLHLRVRQGKAVNVPAELTPEQWKNGLKFELDERNAVTFVGQVQDQHGHPVPKTQLRLSWYFLMKGESGPANGHQSMETAETDEQGRFILKGHWPNERYYLDINKTGYVWPGFPSPSLDREMEYGENDNYKSIVHFGADKSFHMDDMKMGRPGETVDYGVIRIVKDSNLIRGKTVGLDGRTISGIEVIAAAKGRGSLQATTDAQGQFEFGQLLDGAGFLIAKGAGYRPTYIPFQTEGGELKIQMRRSSEPPPAGPIIPKAHLAARQKLIRHILESIWKSRQACGWGGNMLESMVELDPARAREWIDQAPPQEKARWESALKPMTNEEAVRLALINVEDGIAATNQMRPERVGHLLVVGEKLLKTNPEISLRFAEEAVTRCRAMGPDQYIWKTSGLAGAGALVWKAGQKESGRKLIQEGIDILQKDPGNRNFVDSSRWICADLADVDWAEAKKRLDLLADPYHYNFALRDCIVRLAKEDPQAAKDKLSLFKEETGGISSHPMIARLHVAKRIGETDPDGALKVLEELKKAQVFKHSYVQGLTELAIQIQPKDPARAYRLIDQAFDFLDQFDRSAERIGSVPICSLLGAQIIYLAQRIDYPDPHALIARTLGYLGKPPVEKYPGEKENWRQTVIALALIDPVLAKNVLQMHTSVEELVKEWSGGDGPSRRSRNSREAGFILALIAPEKTMAAFDAMGAKGWTSDTVSRASISEIFGSLSKKGDLRENIRHWEMLMWLR